MEGASMEFWVRLSISEHGRDDENGSRLFVALEAVTQDPLVDQSFSDGRLSGAFWVRASDAGEAVEVARGTLLDALDRAGLRMTRLIGIEVSAEDYAEVPAA
jgi:hypothetical protein